MQICKWIGLARIAPEMHSKSCTTKCVPQEWIHGSAIYQSLETESGFWEPTFWSALLWISALVASPRITSHALKVNQKKITWVIVPGEILKNETVLSLCSSECTYYTFMLLPVIDLTISPFSWHRSWLFQKLSWNLIVNWNICFENARSNFTKLWLTILFINIITNE